MVLIHVFVFENCISRKIGAQVGFSSPKDFLPHLLSVIQLSLFCIFICVNNFLFFFAKNLKQEKYQLFGAFRDLIYF